jgi:DNA polymerase III delta prime subunit
VIVAPTIPPDAQNALLKTFEEPVAGTKFFLIVASPETLLPTLRSRMQVLEIAGEFRDSPVNVREYLRSSSEKRVELLKPLLEKGDDDKRDLSGTIEFLSGLERALAASPKENSKGLHAIYRARRYITDRGALAKTLLEQTAFIIPKVL